MRCDHVQAVLDGSLDGRNEAEENALAFLAAHQAAAPAVGHRSVHVEQQERLVDEALTGRINPSMNRRIPVPVAEQPAQAADASPNPKIDGARAP